MTASRVAVPRSTLRWGVKDIAHFIVTRFNLPTPGLEQKLRASANWLEDRFRLFEQFCLPSVKSQTVRDFKWLIYFDPQSPDWAMDKIRCHRAEEFYVPLFRERVMRDDLLNDIAAAAGQKISRLLTTRLDNDDLIVRDFIERLQRKARALSEMPRVALNFPNGFTYANGFLHHHIDKSSAFASLLEDWEDARTIWVDMHTKLRHHAPVLQMDDVPAWIQVIHGSNVSNRVRGRLVNARVAAAAFPPLATELKTTRPSDIAKDTLKHYLVRVPREGIRLIGKFASNQLLSANAREKVKSVIRG